MVVNLEFEVNLNLRFLHYYQQAGLGEQLNLHWPLGQGIIKGEVSLYR